MAVQACNNTSCERLLDPVRRGRRGVAARGTVQADAGSYLSACVRARTVHPLGLRVRNSVVAEHEIGRTRAETPGSLLVQLRVDRRVDRCRTTFPIGARGMRTQHDQQHCSSQYLRQSSKPCHIYPSTSDRPQYPRAARNESNSAGIQSLSAVAVNARRIVPVEFSTRAGGCTGCRVARSGRWWR
jgi:hypothetical protein